MKYLIYAKIITKPEKDFGILKFEVEAKSVKEAIGKVEQLHYTNGLINKDYDLLTIGYDNKNCWEWNGFEFDTLSMAKACIEGDFNSVIKDYVQDSKYNKIAKYVHGVGVSSVKVSVDKNGYAIFSKPEKNYSILPCLA